MTDECRNVKCKYVYDPMLVEVNSKLRIVFGVRRRGKLIQRVIDSDTGRKIIHVSSSYREEADQ
jgi:hypothetical protein